MMVSCVRGHFKNVRGTLEFHPGNPRLSAAEAVIDVRELCTGVKDRDTHLLSVDFLEGQNHPEIKFRGNQVELVGSHDARLTGELTIRGVTRPVTLEVRYLGQWETPWWEDGVEKGPSTRAGFLATTKINRHDFGVSWNTTMDKGGIVVGNEVEITIDVEAILDS